MDKLQLWTRCCEVSVAGSIHDCFGEELRHNLLARLGAHEEDQQ